MAQGGRTRGLLVTGTSPAISCDIVDLCGVQSTAPDVLLLRVDCYAIIGGALAPIDAGFSQMALE